MKVADILSEQRLIQSPSVGKITPEQLQAKIVELAATVSRLAKEQSPDKLQNLTSKTAALHEHAVALVKYYKDMA